MTVFFIFHKIDVKTFLNWILNQYRAALVNMTLCNNWGENYWSVNVNMRNWSGSKVSEFTVCFRSMKNQSKFGWTYWSVISSGWCVGDDDHFFFFLENWLETFIKNEPKEQKVKYCCPRSGTQRSFRQTSTI